MESIYFDTKIFEKLNKKLTFDLKVKLSNLFFFNFNVIGDAINIILNK